MRVEHQKLVRDRIPEIIRARGGAAVTRVLDEREYLPALLDKLVEEAQEARAAGPQELPVELADLVEVMAAVLEQLGTSWADITAIATEKRARAGGFRDRMFLEHTIDPDQ
jgi:predicted house-cleaning noncanonical NTP pyrophosphatase (MazG superfamily)